MEATKFYACNLEGEWIHTYKSYNCSICGKIALSIQTARGYTQFFSDYCPHCGAHMTWEKKNETDN